MGFAGAGALVEAARGVLGDVLGEGPGRDAGGEDARDGLVLEGAEGAGVAQRGAQVGRRVALAQEQDLARLVSGQARRRDGEPGKEVGGVLAHAVESRAQLLAVGPPAIPRRVDALGVDVDARAPRRELVPGHAAQVRGVDQELALRHAHGHDVGDVLVGHRVAIALPGNEAVDGAHPIDDPGGVVGMAGQRPQVRRLLGKHGERRALALLVRPLVEDVALPDGELGAHVVEVVEAPAIEEAPLEVPEGPFDPRLVVGLPGPAGLGAKFVVAGEGQEARVVDRLLALPPEDDRLLAVVLARVGGAGKLVEGLDVPVDERVKVAALVEAEAPPRREAEDVGEGLHDGAAPAAEVDAVRRPVGLGHLAGAMDRRGQARLGSRRRPHRADMLLDRGVAAVVARALQLLEDALRRDVRVAREELGDAHAEVVELAGTRRALGWRRERLVRLLTCLGMLREDLPDRVAADPERSSDRTAGQALPAQGHGLVNELLAGGPGRHGTPW